MSTENPTNIAIIGAGLAGLSLALALHKHNPSIKTTLYELRHPTTNTTGALMLSPNALQILDSLEVYQRIKSHGYEFEKLVFKDDNNVVQDEYFMGHEKLFGYKALRVYRQVLLDELRNAASERGIDVQYGRKFSKVISEDEKSVTFELEDGSRETAAMLIGADGIHSKVRTYIHPKISPIYSGITAVTSAIDISNLRIPGGKTAEYPLPVSIHGPMGAFVMAPQNPSGTELLIGRQFPQPELSKTGWDEFRSSKKELAAMICRNQSEWSDVVQSAMENTIPEKTTIWPFYVVPKMGTWFSGGKRVMILGDAAHAIPPTAGQGASQAFEDVFSFSLLLSQLTNDKGDWKMDGSILEKWQGYRMGRIDKILDLTKTLNEQRLPAEELKKLGKTKEDLRIEGGVEGQRWLFEPRIEEHVSGLI